jgi:hypothetical protein
MIQQHNKSRYISKNYRFLNEVGLYHDYSPLYRQTAFSHKIQPGSTGLGLSAEPSPPKKMVTAMGIENNISVPMIIGMVATVSVSAQPAPLPGNLVIAGRYDGSEDITGTGKGHSDVTLVYNTHTGNLTGLPANAARHSFGYNMGKLNIDRSKLGIFYWGADMRNKNYYPALSNSLFLLKNGDLAAARISQVEGGTDYEVAKKDVSGIVVFSKSAVAADLQEVAIEIGSLASKLWGGNIFEENGMKR